MDIQLIGPVTGFSSYPTVLKGLIRGLAAGGIEATVADTSHMGGEHANGDLVDVEGIEWLGSHETARVSAGDVGAGTLLLALNPPVQLAKGVADAGAGLVGMYVGDVDRVPAEWIETMTRAALVCVPSRWMARVVRKGLEEHGIERQVLVVPHGVGAAMRPDGLHSPSMGRVPGASPEGWRNSEAGPAGASPEGWRNSEAGTAGASPEGWRNPRPASAGRGPVRVLHPCSAIYYPERKGTPAAIRAVAELVREGYDLRLTLLVPQLTRPLKRLLEEAGKEAKSWLTVRKQPDGMPAGAMAEVYLEHDVLLCPSRAEGFGMMALECRACGRPVVQTLVTGMRDHFERGEWCVAKGVVQVPHGEMVPAWGDFGEAPEVTAEMVKTAMRFFVHNRAQLERGAAEHASEVAERWAWERVTSPLVEALRAIG